MLRKSAKFKAADAAARRDGIKHRAIGHTLRLTLRTQQGVEGLVTDHYHVMVGGEEGNQRLLIFSLLYQKDDGSIVQNRWMSAVVDSRGNDVLSAIDVDATGVGDGVHEGGIVGASPNTLNVVMGRARTPAGRLRLQGQGLDLNLNNGAWSGTPTLSSGGISGQGDEIVEDVQEVLYCWAVKSQWCLRICPWGLIFGPKGAGLCYLACEVITLTHCIVITID